ncbi:MAG: hypothetical protein CVU65_05675 [Deltaproteobacteria bacterium HGW-Deltaproteobacteria-22]|nr:MAG: hypothetical protein CVU65_05675 [Deltaproteobacteria bacterium HGW-Deltaproteobacteria-22]
MPAENVQGDFAIWVKPALGIRALPFPHQFGEFGFLPSSGQGAEFLPHRINNCTTISHELGEIQVQHFVQLPIEVSIIRPNGAIAQIPNFHSAMVSRGGGIIHEVSITLPGVAVLPWRGIAFTTLAAGKEVGIRQLFIRVLLAMPVGDLHLQRFNSRHAIRAQMPLFTQQLSLQVLLGLGGHTIKRRKGGLPIR